ncbi:hypothetical protein EVAR_81517_1 [Eumeta japonica]|uniref:Uncharacterized protein n=1 Tax=Eumeta variegata TaxID=151549 RepID=A0A4C1W2P0_EUMVA|nr:hypothetical protein EVAR_81517_1 [Eumeta japonica]
MEVYELHMDEYVKVCDRELSPASLPRHTVPHSYFRSRALDLAPVALVWRGSGGVHDRRPRRDDNIRELCLSFFSKARSEWLKLT